jgi:chromosomal replication initiator protein
MRDWEEFIRQQEERIGKEAADKWLRTLAVTHFDAGNLYLQARDSFQALWFEEHVRVHVEESLRNRNNRKIHVHIKVASDPAEETSKRSKRVADPGGDYQLLFDALTPHCTFESFAPTSGTRLAWEVLRRISLSPTDPEAIGRGSYNPIFLHGPSGSGKSHLLMATAAALTQQGLRCIYTRGMTFTEHVVTAIRAGAMQVFRAAYRQVDCLLIDDIEVLSNKSATQEELFHTFNALHVAGRQLILAANCAPGELKAIEPRLVSRFEWGLSCALELALPEELPQVIARKAAAMRFSPSQEVLSFLVKTWQKHPKEMVQALEALALRRNLQPLRRGKDPAQNAAVAQEALSDLIERSQRPAATPENVVAAVATRYKIETSDVLGKSQTRVCSLARQICMYLCRNVLHLPFPKIGDIFDRNHSTVMTSVKQIQKMIDSGNREVAAVLRQIRKALSEGTK